MIYKQVHPGYWFMRLQYRYDAFLDTIDIVDSSDSPPLIYCRWTTWIEKVEFE